MVNSSVGLELRVRGIFNWPGILVEFTPTHAFLESAHRKIDQIFTGEDAIFEAIYQTLVAPLTYPLSIMRQHLVNVMKLDRDRLEVNIFILAFIT